MRSSGIATCCVGLVLVSRRSYGVTFLGACSSSHSRKGVPESFRGVAAVPVLKGELPSPDARSENDGAVSFCEGSGGGPLLLRVSLQGPFVLSWGSSSEGLGLG